MRAYAPVALFSFLFPSFVLGGPVDDAKLEWSVPDDSVGNGFPFKKVGAADRRVTSCAEAADAVASGYTRDLADFRAGDGDDEKGDGAGALTLKNRVYDDRINRALAANRKICTN